MLRALHAETRDHRFPRQTYITYTTYATYEFAENRALHAETRDYRFLDYFVNLTLQN